MTIIFDPGNYSGQQVRKEGGIVITSSLSPYVVPQGLEYQYDPAENVLVADFSFINSEATNTVDLPHEMVGYIGLNTKILRRVNFNNFRGDYRDALRRVAGLAHALKTSLHAMSHPSALQYDMIEKILHDTLTIIVKQ